MSLSEAVGANTEHVYTAAGVPARIRFLENPEYVLHMNSETWIRPYPYTEYVSWTKKMDMVAL